VSEREHFYRRLGRIHALREILLISELMHADVISNPLKSYRNVPRSLLLEGILAENPEAARAQVWTFDHATIAGEISRRVLRLAEQASQKLPLIDPLVGSLAGSFSQCAPSDSIRHARDDDLILPIGPPDWPAAKLGRILKHFHLAFAAGPFRS
jgi:hypothetical protein